jgi:outer membrane protein TolC
VPRNDLNEVKANLAQRSSARVNSEQQVVSAEQQLSLDMGLAPAEMLGRAADPTDDLPTPDDDQPMPENDPASLSDYLDQALAQRADYLAAKQRLGEADIVDVAAKNRLLPQVDFVVGSSYAAVRDGTAISDFFSAPGTGLAGPSATATVNYTFLGGNHSARGALRQADASRRQAALQLEQVSRNITADLVTSVAAVRNGIIRSRSAKLAVESFDAALAGAREKYRLGLGSVIDILTLEDKLNSAQTDEIQARLAYAIALTQFRLATGTLLPGGRTRQVLDSSMFVTPPFTGRTRRP